MKILFHESAWEDYVYFQARDKKITDKINKLTKDISRCPHEGIGKPEALKHSLTGLWSRRINLRAQFSVCGKRRVYLYSAM